MRFSLGRRAEQWNEIAGTDARVCGAVRGKFFERVCCELMGRIQASDLRVLLGIAARTLRFHKFAEAISQEELCRGFRDDDGELLLDANDAPYFAGCNIAKAETIGQAAARLEREGLITKWPLRRSSWSTVYMPFSEDWLASTAASSGGAIAEDYGSVVLQEHWQTNDGRYFRVDAMSEDSILLQPLNTRLNNAGESWQLSAAEWSAREFTRLSVQQIRQARGHRQTWSDYR